MTCNEAREAILTAAWAIVEQRGLEFDKIVLGVHDYFDDEAGEAPVYGTAVKLPAPRPALAGPDVVYGTVNGKKYHTEACHHCTPACSFTVADANRKGLAPCKHCNPPLPKVAPLASAAQRPGPTSASRSTASSPSNENSRALLVTVYRTSKGKKYHTNKCRHYNPNLSLSVTEAKGRGLAPCSMCGPPSVSLSATGARAQAGA